MGFGKPPRVGLLVVRTQIGVFATSAGIDAPIARSTLEFSSQITSRSVCCTDFST